MRNHFHAAVAALCILAPTAQAQSSGYHIALGRGSAVRVTTMLEPSRRIVGKVLAMPGDTIILDSNSAQVKFPLAALNSLEIRGEEDKRRGFTIGAVALGGIAVVFGGIDYSKDRISGGDWFSTIVGNALIGGLIGYAFAPKGWDPLPLPSR